MNTTEQKAKRALTLTTTLTLFVAGFEVFIAYTNYKPGNGESHNMRKA